MVASGWGLGPAERTNHLIKGLLTLSPIPNLEEAIDLITLDHEAKGVSLFGEHLGKLGG